MFDGLFSKFHKKRKRNEQPCNARMAHRAAKLAALMELYNVPLSEECLTELAGKITEIPDRELEKIHAGTLPIPGCPAGIIPIFAGYSQKCAVCPYFSREPTDEQPCALKEP